MFFLTFAPLKINKGVSVLRKINEPHQIPIAQTKVEEPQQHSDDEADQFSTIKRSPRDLDKKTVSSPTIQQQELMKNDLNKQEFVEKEEVLQQISEQQIVDEIIYGDFSTPGLQARALYDYQAGKGFIKLDVTIFFI